MCTPRKSFNLNYLKLRLSTQCSYSRKVAKASFFCHHQSFSGILTSKLFSRHLFIEHVHSPLNHMNRLSSTKWRNAVNKGRGVYLIGLGTNWSPIYPESSKLFFSASSDFSRSKMYLTNWPQFPNNRLLIFLMYSASAHISISHIYNWRAGMHTFF